MSIRKLLLLVPFAFLINACHEDKDDDSGSASSEDRGS